jgi:hypothetical protein
MKYLVVDTKTEEKVFCDSEREAATLIEDKLRQDSAETDIQVFGVEPVNFQVDRVPVVSLDQSDPPEVAMSDQSASSDETDFAARLSDLTAKDDSSAKANPFVSEEIFSLDA